MRVLLLEQDGEKTLAQVKNIDSEQLPEGDVTVDVNWSSLNYKDALAITGTGKIIRHFPMVPGIDFAGLVHSSKDPRFKPGQSVVLTGWALAKITGAGWANRPALAANGWYHCHKGYVNVKR